MGIRKCMGGNPSYKLVMLCTLLFSIKVFSERVPRLVGGLSSYTPYQVSLVDTQTQAHYCGGAILNSFFIITAAHCLTRKIDFKGTQIRTTAPMETENVRVVAGQNDLQWPDHSEQVRFVEDFFVHPAFDPRNLENDIGLIQLRTPLKINSFVQPISLPVHGREFRGNVTVFGWGSLGIFPNGIQEKPTTLQVGTMSIISNSECQKALSKGDNVFSLSRSMFCVQSANVSVCKGDSGSPGVCRDENLPHHSHNHTLLEILCGIASWGAPGEGNCVIGEDGRMRSLGSTVYTKVSFFTKELVNVIRNKDLGPRYFLCDNLEVIPSQEKCDFTPDCKDGSDEYNCTLSTKKTTTTTTTLGTTTTEPNLGSYPWWLTTLSTQQTTTTTTR